MGLRDDVGAGLAAIDAPGAAQPLRLDERGACLVNVPIPAQVAALSEGVLRVQVRMSRTGKRFSLRTPLAALRESPDAALLEALLRRVYYPDQLSGLGVSLSSEDDALVAHYHWLLDEISAAQFSSLFAKFSTGALVVIRELAAMARRDPAIAPVHPDAS